MLEPFQSPALRTLDVSVAGEWRPDRYRDWHGEARASEPIVAVSFAEAAGVVLWCKSQRPQADAQPVRLLLGSYDAGDRDVQVNFSIGDGHVIFRTEVESPSYFPPIPAVLMARTGELVRIVPVDGSRKVDLYALFLAGSDIKVGRNGLWHLRKDLISEVPGHTGTCSHEVAQVSSPLTSPDLCTQVLTNIHVDSTNNTA